VRITRITFFFGLSCLLGLQEVCANDAEGIFSDALNYTVRIKTSIATPFIEDEQGAIAGAGFIVDSSRRWVMTNAHVVGHSPATVRVGLYGEDHELAEKVYVDPYLDLAILELAYEPGQQLVAAPLACDNQPRTGHPVGAFGHPWGLDYTGTQGVISGRTSMFGGELLQTDAPINGGNSGGPLMSLKSGKVIGINTARMNSEDDQNTNFAVSVAHACRVLELLAAGQDPSPPDLPLDFFDLAQEGDPLIIAKSYLEPGLLDLERGDEILAVADLPIENEGQLIHALRGRLNDITLTVRRDGELVTLEGRLLPARNVIERRGIGFAGILLASGDLRDRAALGLGHDIMVHGVAPGSEADGADLYYFDYLVSIDGVRVTGLDQVYDLLDSVSGRESIKLDFLRVGTGLEQGWLYRSVRREFMPARPEKVGAWERNRISRAD